MRTVPFWRNDSGATAVEIGLTAPVFFMVLFGTIEFGLIAWAQIGLQHGAEMAARCASVNRTLCGSSGAIQSYAAQQAYGFNPPPSTFTVTSAACGNQVSASYPLPFLTPYLSSTTISLSAQSCFPK